MNAILFDLPRVIDAVGPRISLSSVASRIEIERGDFFRPEALPQGDLFGLGRILHDWPDDKVSGLLRFIQQRLPSGGGILLAEKLLQEDKAGPVAAQLQSLNMLVCTEGKERTLGEFRALLESAGFTDVRGCVTGAPLDAIFAVKA
jgi:acetylserotonin O-methyltransferase